MLVSAKQKNIVVLWLLVAALVIQCLPITALAAEAQTDAPNVGNCTIYHYDPVYSAGNPDPQPPTLYMWNVRETVTIRVYQGSSGDNLIGSGQSQTIGACGIIPLDGSELNRNGGTVYVSQQAEGKAESERVALAYGKVGNPGASFRVYQFSGTTSNGVTYVNADASMTAIPRPSVLAVGGYYVVDVVLENIGLLQNLILPIKYDPSYLQLVSVNASTQYSGRYELSDTLVDTGANGAMMKTFLNDLNYNGTYSSYRMGGYPPYGVGIYRDAVDWGGQQVLSASTEAETPYLNTETGLLKVELSTPGPDYRARAMPTTPAKMLRLYFKCLQKPTADVAGTSWTNSPILHFATEEDIPEGVTDFSEQMKYYCAISPDGVTAGIQSLNLLTPPLSATEGNPCSEAMPLSLTAEEIGALPQSLSQSDQIRTLLENQVKIYNYTNYGAYGTLDYAARVEDVLLLTPSATVAGAARQGDQITVYDSDGTTVLAGPETVDSEGGIQMLLGTNNLKKEGGQVYLTVTRSGTEHTKIAVNYGAEASRDVYFRVYSSGYNGADGADLSKLSVSRGDQIQLKLYFDNFDDLLGYTFALHFDSNVVQVADSQYNALQQDGYIDENMFRTEESCFSVGEDLADVTMNEAIVYELWTRYQNAGAAEKAELESEIEADMKILGIETREEFEQIAMDAGVKYSVGADSLPWKGGMLFTGPAREAGTNGSDDPGRAEDTLYPYVNNKTGLVKIASASLVRPPLTLHKGDVNGYHFLSVYFVATGSGIPGFRLATAIDGAGGFDAATPEGGEIVLAGPGRSATAGGAGSSAENVSSMPYTAHWQAYYMEAIEKKPIIKLLQGNALSEDEDSTAMFLYSGYAYRDPGFTLKDRDGKLLDNTLVTRYFMDGEEKIELPPWTEGEALTEPFGVRKNSDGTLKTSDSYELVYEYSYTEDGVQKTQSVTRMVYVIFKRGDVNRDEAIDVFDEQVLANHLGGISTLALTDDVYFRKTVDICGDGSLTTAKEALHRYLLGLGSIEQDYIMPVEKEPETGGSGAENAPMRLYLELYDAANPAVPLEPTELRDGQEIVAVIRYENLDAVAGNGLQSIAVSLGYDENRFSLSGFEESTGSATVQWTGAAINLSEGWISEALKNGYTADASDRADIDGRRRVYIQYVAGTNRSDGMILSEPEGSLGAFSFQVKGEFAVADGIYLTWEDHALGAYGDSNHTVSTVSELNAGKLLSHPGFRAPEDVLTATVSSASEGVSVSGTIYSYNRYNDITVQLYRMDELENAEAKPITVIVPGEPYEGMWVSGRAATDFEIHNIPAGTYQLRISKGGHLTTYINNLVVTVTDLELDMTELNAGRVFVSSGYESAVNLITGDLNGDRQVTTADRAVVMDADNTDRYIGTDSAPSNPFADLSGDGQVTTADRAIIMDSMNLDKTETDCTFDYS